MSRLTEIMDNHDHLDELSSLLKHYAVNAEFVSFALIEQFKEKEVDASGEDEESSEDSVDQQYTAELLEDLHQFYARF